MQVQNYNGPQLKGFVFLIVWLGIIKAKGRFIFERLICYTNGILVIFIVKGGNGWNFYLYTGDMQYLQNNMVKAILENKCVYKGVIFVKGQWKNY